jgi:hypothetical protein
MNVVHETAKNVPRQRQLAGHGDINDGYPQSFTFAHCQRQNCLWFGMNGVSRLFLLIF